VVRYRPVPPSAGVGRIVCLFLDDEPLGTIDGGLDDAATLIVSTAAALSTRATA
jgi:hypothetical protein